jgi:hypothetical protein
MKLRPWPAGLSRGGYDEGPVGTLIFYGPDNRHASKVVASIVANDGDDPRMKKLLDDRMDVRVDRGIGREVAQFFRRHDVRRIAIMEGIFGCPHEETIDYPSGGVCPECPFWATHDRYAEVVPAWGGVLE